MQWGFVGLQLSRNHDRRTGVNNVVGGPIAQIGIDVFNGDGTRGLIRSTRSTNGEIQGWTDFPPSGSYTVHPDCTGSFFDADGAKTNNVIVLDGGKGFFLLSLAPDTITTDEGKRLEVEERGLVSRYGGCEAIASGSLPPSGSTMSTTGAALRGSTRRTGFLPNQRNSQHCAGSFCILHTRKRPVATAKSNSSH
jgi:hypothetical protein